MDLLIGWQRCVCYVWPIVLGQKVGRCGRCGERPKWHDNQDETVARPLTADERVA